jgi:hypothetical protein
LRRPRLSRAAAPDTAACGYPFTIGTKYLVYASSDGNAYRASLCSRTARLADARNDLELLRQSAVGTPRPRLFGTIYRLQLRAEGTFMQHDTIGGVENVAIRVTDRGQVREVRTDPNGRFTIDGLAAGTYAVDLRLPPHLSPLHDESMDVQVGACAGELYVPVTTVPLRGTARAMPGEERARQVMLRIAQVGADGSVAVERTAIAFTEADGTWTLPGLPAGRYLVGVSTFDPPTPYSPYPTR